MHFLFYCTLFILICFTLIVSSATSDGLNVLSIVKASSIRLSDIHLSSDNIQAILELNVFDRIFSFSLSEWQGLHKDAQSHLHQDYLLLTGSSQAFSHPSQIVKDIDGRKKHDASFIFRSQDTSLFKWSLIEGQFTTFNDTYHISTIERYSAVYRSGLDVPVPNVQNMDQSNSFVVYRSSDRTIPSNETFSCGLEHISNDLTSRNTFVFDPFPQGGIPSSLHRRQMSAGCPSSNKIIYVGISLDCNYITKYGSEQAARERALLNFMLVSNLYSEQFNILIGVLDVLTFPDCNDNASATFNLPCSQTVNMSKRLSEFSHWRGTQSDAAGLWHLYTACPSGATIGLAWLSLVCSTDAYSQPSDNGGIEYVSGTGVTASPLNLASDNEWLITAHEIGHNFGAQHDCTSSTNCLTSNSGCCSCSSDVCNACSTTWVMNPVSKVDQHQFSPCSVKQICSQYGVLGTCLSDPGTKLVISIAQCGNGIVEDGEQCDCGGASQCAQSNCCNTNCTLKAEAQCDDKSDACCRSCRTVSRESTLLCRPANGECDKPEYCDGTSKQCPKDEYQPNGGECTLPNPGIVNNPKGRCASGECTTRDHQCIVQGRIYQGKANETYIDSIVGECPNLFGGQCNLICQSSVFGCRPLPGTFRDGTPCGQGGMCMNGVCSEETAVASAVQWASGNVLASLGIGMGVALIVGCAGHRVCMCSNRRKTYGRINKPS